MSRAALSKFVLFFTILAFLSNSAPAQLIKNFRDGSPARATVDQLLGRTAGASDVTGDGIFDSADATYRSFGDLAYRINVGGGEYTDAGGHLWSAGAPYAQNGADDYVGSEVPLTNRDPLYQTQYVQVFGAPPMQFSFPVGPGVYQLRVHLAEMRDAAPQTRVFEIRAEENTTLARVDMAADAGPFIPFYREGIVKCFDGVLNLKALSVEGLASISAIEVFKFEDSDAGKAVVARYNTGGPDYTDPSGRFWASDASIANTGETFAVGQAIEGTDMDPIYQSERFDSVEAPNIAYSFPVEYGVYSVRLHLAELFNDLPGTRPFSIKIEDNVVLTNFDILSNAQKFTSLVPEFTVPVSDGNLNVELLYSIDIAGNADPKINGIEVVHRGPLTFQVSSGLIQWENRELFDVGDKRTFYLLNPSDVPMPVTNINFRNKRGFANDFSILVDGIPYWGNYFDMEYQTPFVIPANGKIQVEARYRASLRGDHMVYVEFAGPYASATIALAGAAGIGGSTQYPFLEAIVTGPAKVLDADGDGFETAILDGSNSIAFLGGASIAGYEWSDALGNVLGTSAQLQQTYPLGSTLVRLTVADNFGNVRYTDYNVIVESIAAVPGVLAHYYKNRSAGPEFLLDSITQPADFAEIIPTFEVTGAGDTIGNSPFTVGVMVQLESDVDISSPGSYVFEATGGTERRLFINGNRNSGGAVVLPVGPVKIEARYAVSSIQDLPLGLTYGATGGTQQPIDAALITHNEGTLAPTINSLPNRGSAEGGESIRIYGLGFFPPETVEVQWGPNVIGAGSLTVNDTTSIDLVTPAGVGTVQVTVRTLNGTSNSVAFSYTDPNAAPVSFTQRDIFSMSNPTKAAWGPDGRLYVANVHGLIQAILFDDNYNVVNVQDITAIQGRYNNTILGLAFNPFDPPEPVRLYVTHSLLYQHGGACFDAYSNYPGEVSVITGPNFENAQAIVNGLPVSNHDHAINQIVFDNNGDLLISVGGNTNAGVGACAIGGLDESPFSGAIIKAFTSKPDFNGAITYVETGTGNVNMDQRAGGYVDPAPGVDIEVYAYGIRNSFDMELTTSGRLYAVDNGANAGFGPISTGPFTSTPEYTAPDELELIEYKSYYGHPNRNLGRYDDRLNYWYPGTTPTQGDAYMGPLATTSFSTNGILEYRAQTFGGAMRGEIITQIWNDDVIRYRLSGDGTYVASTNLFPTDLSSLDILTGPGGTVIGLDYTQNVIRLAEPNDNASAGPTIFDVHPWRASSAGGDLLTIGGKNFGSLENTSVTVGGIPAAVEYVSYNRIRARVPARFNAPTELLDINVTTNGTTVNLSSAFRYVGNTVADSGARAYIEIDPGQELKQSSTYVPGTFKVFNNSSNGQTISRVTFDLTTAILPDMVFDPYANAGDSVGKQFEVNANNGGIGTSVNYIGEKDGGYTVLEVNYSGFDPGDNMTFSIDVDPTSINGSSPPGPNDSGSVNGLELAGSTVKVDFSDGTTYFIQPYRKNGTLTGSRNNAKPFLPASPTLEVLGSGTENAYTNNPNQTVRIGGAAQGTPVALLVMECGLFINGNGFDVQEFESNSALQIDEYFATIGASGFADIPVTFKKSENNGGYNVICAVFKDSEGDNGAVSPVIVMKLD